MLSFQIVDVDCEYNRNLRDAKEIDVAAAEI
jgi:hypothetical protein